jgi:hypothetical protein
MALQRINHRLATLRDKKDSFRTAANDFRSVFAETLSTLNNLDAVDTTVEAVLKERHLEHSRAGAVFGEFLPSSTRKRFNRDWQEYHSGHAIDGQHFSAYEWGWEKLDGLYLEYSPYFIGNGIPRINYRDTAIKKTKKLLSYAKHR